MDKKIWQSAYTVIVLPIIYVIVHLLSLFSRQIRAGVFPRHHAVDGLRDWLKQSGINGKHILIHTASLGEFEHIKPLLFKLKKDYGTTNVVTFFSPSGYENVKPTPGLDYYLYMPFDFKRIWKKLYNVYKPELLIISKHDVWPGQIWQAKKMRIPVYLVNASLPENSSRTKPIIKHFLKHVYRDFTNIFAISKDDMHRFSVHYPRCRVKVMGDTKYDQVALRKVEAVSKVLLRKDWIKNKWIFLAGSVWPEDEKHLIPAFKELLKSCDNIAFIIAPHEPEKKHIQTLKTEFAHWGVAFYSKQNKLSDEKIVIVNTIGQLADLYRYARAAYVGGSFKQGIHNVMEPAIYKIPVLYGPIHTDSYEAIQLAKTKGGMVVADQHQIKNIIEKLYSDNKYCEENGSNAHSFAEANIGATDKIMTEWKEIITMKRK